MAKHQKQNEIRREKTAQQENNKIRSLDFGRIVGLHWGFGSTPNEL